MKTTVVKAGSLYVWLVRLADGTVLGHGSSDDADKARVAAMLAAW